MPTGLSARGGIGRLVLDGRRRVGRANRAARRTGDERVVQEVDDLPDLALTREPRRLAVPAAADLARDRRYVDLVVAPPQRDAPCGAAIARRFADERDHLGSLHGAEVVDDPLRVRLLGSDVREILPQQVRDDETAALEELRAVERAREELELRELDRLVDVAEDAVHVGSGLDELGCETE